MTYLVFLTTTENVCRLHVDWLLFMLMKEHVFQRKGDLIDSLPGTDK